jgi:hypothetical protein
MILFIYSHLEPCPTTGFFLKSRASPSVGTLLP